MSIKDFTKTALAITVGAPLYLAAKGCEKIVEGCKEIKTANEQNEVISQIVKSAKENQDKEAGIIKFLEDRITNESEKLKECQNSIENEEFERAKRLAQYISDNINTQNISAPDNTGKVCVQTEMSGVVYNGTGGNIIKSAVAGGVVAGGAVAGVAAFGAAGTGAAIAGLHGAAAVNATLAWLGGGTLAAGGLGVAGGVAALGGLFAVPALAVFGYNYVKDANKKYEKALEYEKEVNKNIKIMKERQAVLSNIQVGIIRIYQETLSAKTYLRQLLDVVEISLLNNNLVSAQDLCWNALHEVARLLNLSVVEKDGAINPCFDETILQIHNKLNSIQQRLGSLLNKTENKKVKDIVMSDDNTEEKFRILHNKEIRKALEETFEQAEERICIMSPWVNTNVLEGLKIENALKRGVHIYISYGIGDKNSEDLRNKRTIESIKTLQNKFKKYEQIHAFRFNTHGKLLICDDKYYILTSFNFLSFDGSYKNSSDKSKEDKREEIGEYLTGKKKIEFYIREYFNFY